MNTNHTPGLRTLSTRKLKRNYETVYFDGEGTPTATLRQGLHKDWKEAAALAVLMGSAPALLAALEGLLQDFHDWASFHNQTEWDKQKKTKALARARAVIAQAKGEQS